MSVELPIGSDKAAQILNQLGTALNSLTSPEILDAGLKEVADRLRSLAQGNSPVYEPRKLGGKYEVVDPPPGTLKKSWTEPTQEGAGLYTFQNPQTYSGVLEAGLYPKEMVKETRADGSPGRLIEVGDGVYSKQAKSGIVGPILQDDAQITSIARLIGKQFAVALQKIMVSQ